MPAPFRRALAPGAVPALALTTALALGACGSSGTSSGDSSSSAGVAQKVQVTSTDDACTLSTTSATAGPVTFTVENTGSDVTEFYVYGKGDRVLGEVENVAPGISRSLTVELTDAGTYTTACKPGMTGDGIRGDFTVTGSADAAGASDASLTAATTDYARYVDEQSELLVTRTKAFVAAVKAGDVARAKRLYPKAREPWERIEPVAESFGDLDPKIDGRADVTAEGMSFTGYHRLEKDLWGGGLSPTADTIADALLSDVRTVAAKASELDYTPLQLANGAKALVDEMATGKVTGEEERYSHTDLHDFEANFDGSVAALDALRPALRERAPKLLTRIDATAADLRATLEEHERADGTFTDYTDLTPDEVKALSDDLDAFSEQVARVAGVVASR